MNCCITGRPATWTSEPRSIMTCSGTSVCHCLLKSTQSRRSRTSHRPASRLCRVRRPTRRRANRSNRINRCGMAPRTPSVSISIRPSRSSSTILRRSTRPNCRSPCQTPLSRLCPAKCTTQTSSRRRFEVAEQPSSRTPQRITRTPSPIRMRSEGGKSPRPRSQGSFLTQRNRRAT